MIVIPFGIIFLIVGFIAYCLNVKADREIAHRQIESRLAEIERRKAAGDTPQPAARSRRVRSRR